MSNKIKQPINSESLIHATFVTQRNEPSSGFLFFWGPNNETYNWYALLKGMGLQINDSIKLHKVHVPLVLPEETPGEPNSGRYTRELRLGVAMEMYDVINILGTYCFENPPEYMFDSDRYVQVRVPPLCPSIVCWSIASRLVLEFVAKQLVVPALKSYRHGMYGYWQFSYENTLAVARIKQLAAAMPTCAHCLQYNQKHTDKKRHSTSIWHPEGLLYAFIDAGIDAFMRQSVRTIPSNDITETALMLSDLPRERSEMPIREYIQTYVEGYENRDLDQELREAEKDVLREANAARPLSNGYHYYAASESGQHVSVRPPERFDIFNPRISVLLRRMRESDDPRAKIMPQKEFVYTKLTELENLKRWESRWFDALTCKKRFSGMDYHLNDPEIITSVQSWLDKIYEEENISQALTPRTGFWLEAPDKDDPSQVWFLRYMVVAEKPGCDDVPPPTQSASNDEMAAEENEKSRILFFTAKELFSTSAKTYRIGEYNIDSSQDLLLSDLWRAAKIFPPIEASLENAQPEGLCLDTQQAWQFISEISPQFLAQGFHVMLPGQVKQQGDRKLQARLHLSEYDGSDKSMFGLNDLVSFKWEAALGDDIISLDEFKKIVEMHQPLVNWNGSWVLVNPKQLSEIESLIADQEESGTMTRFDAMNRALTNVADPNSPNALASVYVEGKLTDVLSKLTSEDVTTITMHAPDSFNGVLRPYQERGVAWLSYQERIGLGCCLADDMGLGKTIQLICHILNHMQRVPDERRGFLLVCPMSVVGNWKREFERFAPSLNVFIHHGADRITSHHELMERLSQPGTVIITTYGLVTRSINIMKSHQFAMIALDEAQAIKNHASKRAMCVKQLDAAFHIALTGTPVENRLSELWSILDFLNPGLLGTNANFQRLYATPIEKNNDEDAIVRLRNLTSPFILRRVKTDPNIIQDLPEKMENKVYCTLTREQATLYQALVNASMNKIENSTGIARHGHVLALLTHLKQIVNHPALFEKGTSATSDRSGKIQMLLDMLETILENGEKSLIFTQFKEMGDLLVEVLREKLHLETIPFLHGGLTASQRDELVDAFQSPDGPPIFILSLKAGGTGLNLTQATHVFHFDRWWNPAVEEQATDRAFRIGQTKNVQVHKFITTGSLEEKIDLMLEDKKMLSNAVVDASGAWVTQLDTDALRELFTLNTDTVVDDVD